jgi:integrase
MAIVPSDGIKGRTYGVRIYRDKGYEWIGTRPTLRAARELEREALARGREPKGPTCDRFATRWLKTLSVKDSTLDSYTTALVGFKRDFAGRPLGSVTVDEAHDWAVANPWRLPVVRALFETARRRRTIAHNPFANLRLPQSRGRKDKPPLTETQVADLATVARRVHGWDDYGPVMAAFVVFTAYTGMRPGEVYALDWADLDVPAQEVHVRRRVYQGKVDLPKGNRARTIALAPEARRALAWLPWPPEGLVFRSKRDRMLSHGTMNQSPRKATATRPAEGGGYWTQIENAWGSKVDIAELRHFCGHLLYVRRDQPARLVAVQLGHRTPSLVETRYGHFEVGALEGLKEAFSAPVGAPEPVRRVS